MKVKLSYFYMGVLINGLNTYREKGMCGDRADDLLLRLIEERNTMNPSRKSKLLLESSESSLILYALTDWKNASIEAGNEIAVETIGELLSILY